MTASNGARAPRSNPRSLVLFAGFTLGACAFVGDYLPGAAGALALALTSTGFAWGMAALLAGYAARRRPAALASGPGLLVAATVTYYLLIVVVGQRWRSGVLADGSSAEAAGLASVGRAVVLWLAVSVAGGLALGYLGSVIRLGTPRWASAAAGTALGLLSGQGLAFLSAFRAWDHLDAFYVSHLLSAGVTVLLAVGGVAALFTHRENVKSWPVFVLASVAACALGLLSWNLIEAIRSGV